MPNFQVVIEGKGAVAAATELQELLAETDLSGTLEVPDEEKRMNPHANPHFITSQ